MSLKKKKTTKDYMCTLNLFSIFFTTLMAGDDIDFICLFQVNHLPCWKLEVMEKQIRIKKQIM